MKDKEKGHYVLILIISIFIILSIFLSISWLAIAPAQPNQTKPTPAASYQLLSATDEENKPSDNLDVIWAVGKETHLWPNVSGCQQFVTKFVKLGSLPSRALASYPGSGNTWLRYLLEGATGIFTGSVYNAASILKAGHLGEGRPFKDGSTIVQKTHQR